MKGFMSVENVGKPVDPSVSSIDITEVALEKGLMNVLNVGSLLIKLLPC